jgi:ATP-dependent DNA ligase
MNVESIRDIDSLSRQIPATYYLFDILLWIENRPQIVDKLVQERIRFV